VDEPTNDRDMFVHPFSTETAEIAVANARFDELPTTKPNRHEFLDQMFFSLASG